MMSTVTEKDVMREFASAAAAEAGLRKKLPSDEMREGGKGTPADGVTAEAPEETVVDTARPTGYRWVKNVDFDP